MVGFRPVSPLQHNAQAESTLHLEVVAEPTTSSEEANNVELRSLCEPWKTRWKRQAMSHSWKLDGLGFLHGMKDGGAIGESLRIGGLTWRS